MKTFDQSLKRLVSNLEEERRNHSRQEIQNTSPYSDAINSRISTITELNVYTSLRLQEVPVDRLSLVIEISCEYLDEKTGLTNLEKMMQGKPPIDPTTKSIIHLHHIGQDFESPFAEIPEAIHQSPKIYGYLHTNKRMSWRNDKQKEGAFRRQKESHWKLRSKQINERQK